MNKIINPNEYGSLKKKKKEENAVLNVLRNNNKKIFRYSSANESKVDELINLLKDEYGFGDSDSTIDYDNEVEDSEFQNYQMPTDGQHRRINKEGNLIAEGEWKNRILVKGTEFDYLILVTSGNLIFKPDCPGDPYDASDDFDYVKYDQYGWHLHDFPFLYSREAIVQHGLEKFYVVDFKVTEKSEQMFHIRTLKEFLEIMSPDYLKELQSKDTSL